MYIVYCTTNVINKYIYVGVHKCDTEKFDGYIGCGVYASQPHTYNHPKTKFQAAVQKYGPSNFKRVILKTFENEEDAYFMEYIIVNEDFLKRKDVYNQILGGGNPGVCNARKCYQYSLEGSFIKEYDSQIDAANAVNRCVSTIKYAIKNKLQAANYFWTYEYVNYLDLTQFKTDNNKIPVYQYSDTGEYDCCYESVSDAARVNNSSSSNIGRSCKLGYKTNNKYFSYTLMPTFDKARKQSLKNTKVYQYSLSGEFIAEYNSCADAERAINKSRGLSSAIKRGITFGNYQWTLEKFDKIKPIEVKGQARKVGQYDLDGNLIHIYNTVTECTKDFSGCRHVLQGRNKTSGGYIFKYIE